jgi:gas vesicle protein
MAFDVLSFLAGVGVGVLTGALAGILHGLERTANLQERLRHVTREVEQMGNVLRSSSPSDSHERDVQVKADQLQRELEEIHEEIKRMYKRTTH